MSARLRVGGERATTVYKLIGIAKLNGIVGASCARARPYRQLPGEPGYRLLLLNRADRLARS